MTRYLCPDCEGGGVILLNDDLSCDICGGRYSWEGKDVVDKIEKELEKGDELE